MSSNTKTSPFPLVGESRGEEVQVATSEMANIAIRVSNLSKCYHLYDAPRDRLKQFVVPPLQRLIGKSPKRHFREFWALKDVSFEVRKGETVGIIGRNGSGKSTLLQMICGTLAPTIGTVETHGRVAVLLELGSGFNPEFTGRENVYMNGAVLGLSKEEIDGRFDAIAAFADIGQFIDQPVKTYSSGMSVRLAFAVQSQLDPDILIIDEALSVGDFFFQQKCFSYIRGLCEKGVTLLFVSHDMSTVRDICSRAIYLKDGRVQFVGQTQTAIRQLLAEKNAGANHTSYATDAVETAKAQELQAILRDCIWAAAPDAPGDDGGRLIAVAFYDNEGECSTSFRMGGVMCIKVVYRPAMEMPTHVSVEIRNKYNQVVTSIGSSRLGLTPPVPQQGRPIIFEMRINLLLEAGNYSVMVNLGYLTAPNQGENLDSSASIGPVVVQWDYRKDRSPFLGMVGLPVEGGFKTLPVRGGA